MSDQGPIYLIRPASPRDLDGFKELRRLAGPGFTSLMVDDDTLLKRLKAAASSFADPVRAPGAERYMLVLEHLPTGAIVGSAAVKATVGSTPPFFNFRVLTIAQASGAAQRRFDMDVLILVNEFTGATEVGSLFVHAEHRLGGIGRALAQTRYMLMAAAPYRFHTDVVSELRGVVDADGRSPFWEHLGRHFFQMSFQEADKLSATTDNQFILDLMPKYPIYVDLLPPEARAVIGEAHPEGQGARRLLEWEGFRYEHVVDIFDGGPLMSVGRDTIRTSREARRLPLRTGDVAAGKRGLAACPEIARFRCAPTRIAIKGEEAIVPAGLLAALGMEEGETGLVWVSDAQ